MRILNIIVCLSSVTVLSLYGNELAEPRKARKFDIPEIRIERVPDISITDCAAEIEKTLLETFKVLISRADLVKTGWIYVDDILTYDPLSTKLNHEYKSFKRVLAKRFLKHRWDMIKSRIKFIADIIEGREVKLPHGLSARSRYILSYLRMLRPWIAAYYERLGPHNEDKVSCIIKVKIRLLRLAILHSMYSLPKPLQDRAKEILRSIKEFLDEPEESSTTFYMQFHDTILISGKVGLEECNLLEQLLRHCEEAVAYDSQSMSLLAYKATTKFAQLYPLDLHGNQLLIPDLAGLRIATTISCYEFLAQNPMRAPVVVEILDEHSDEKL